MKRLRKKYGIGSRTPQGCVDRNSLYFVGDFDTDSRTPQGCVDRNRSAYAHHDEQLQSHPAGVRG